MHVGPLRKYRWTHVCFYMGLHDCMHLFAHARAYCVRRYMHKLLCACAFRILNTQVSYASLKAASLVSVFLDGRMTFRLGIGPPGHREIPKGPPAANRLRNMQF